MEGKFQLRPRRVALLYVLLAGIWIVGSDYVANHILRMPQVHSWKGLAFVLATATLLYAILARADRSIRDFTAGLMASREQFQLLVERAPEAIFIQAAGEFRYVNPAALRLFGTLDRSALLGRPVLDLVPAQDHALVAGRIRDSLEKRVPLPLREGVYLRTDGTPVDVEVSASPCEFEGEPGAVVFVRDISERIRAERQEEHLREQVRQAQRMESLGRLAGGVAHDFNNLLTVINGYSDMLLTEWTEGDAAHCLREIHDAGQRAASLTRHLLAFSRKDVGERVVLDVNAVVRDAERMLARLVGEHIRLSTVLDPAAACVWADSSWLDQILMNLVVNSRDAMPTGGSIEVRTADAAIGEEYCRTRSDARPGRYVQVTVTDTGAGMSPDVIARACEPFFTTKPQGQGTGLGLSTVYGIVRNCQGWVDIESEVGRGTAVHTWFPAGGAGAAALETPGAVQLRGSETILLVEDDQVVRQATAAMLRRYGYGVVAVGGGAEAVRIAGSPGARIDLLLSDVMMPDMNGVELAEKVRRLRPGVRVMLMSGYRPDEVAAAAPELPFLSKPFTAVTLAARIRALFDGR
jgi:two-component system, cell cycle sensor histidine kinase and response regulator CckA